MITRKRSTSRGSIDDKTSFEELQIPFTAEDVAMRTTEEFNLLLERHKLSEEQLLMVHDVRRRVKNKVRKTDPGIGAYISETKYIYLVWATREKLL